MLELKTPDVKDKQLKKTLRIIGLTTIGAFIALLIFGYFFPTQVTVENTEPENSTHIGFDPAAILAAKVWNNFNQETQDISIDECNSGRRIDSHTWQITLKDC